MKKDSGFPESFFVRRPPIHGQPIKKLTGDNILDQFMEEIYKI